LVHGWQLQFVTSKAWDTLQVAQQHYAQVAAFKLPKGVQTANVLLLGPAGAGKSSLVNTIDTLVKGRLSRRANYGGGTSTLTTTLRKYTFTAPPTGVPIPFALWDTRGWCPESYKSGNDKWIVAVLGANAVGL
jgi:septin family protein